MSPVLEQKLAERFHFMRQDKDANGLYEGFYCDFGDGWNSIIWSLCEDIEAVCSNEPRAQISPIEIKEKYGQLRFYYGLINGSDGLWDEVGKIVNKWEVASENTCIHCGAVGILRLDLGWILPLCNKCYLDVT